MKRAANISWVPLICFVSILAVIPLYSNDLFINEVMSSNSTTISDADDEYPDWVELYNAGAEPIQLLNYALSDDSQNPTRWIFPKIEIEPQNHLLVFTSGKNRRAIINHWETIVDLGNPWQYHYPTEQTPANWNGFEFDEFSADDWFTGISGLGYEDGDDSTIVDKTVALFIKHRFNLENISDIQRVVLHVDYDDAFVAYLNGIEVARANIGESGVPPAFNKRANYPREAIMYQGLQPEVYEIVDYKSLLVSGENILGVQVHNASAVSSDLSIIPILSMGMQAPPVDPRGLSSFLKFEQTRTRLHTNFRLKGAGEELLFWSPSGGIIDSLTTESILTDISYGRAPDGSENWTYFKSATPDTSNYTQSFPGVINTPSFSYSAGIYPSGFNLELSSNDPSVNIHYEIDGQVPTQSSPQYISPILVNNDPDWPSPITIIRARAFKPGWISSRVVTHSYIINSSTDLPIVSLVTDPANFFSNDSGIYVMGNDAVGGFPYWGANFWSKCPQDQSTSVAHCPFEPWERPVHIDFFEPGKEEGFSLDAGARIVGHWARGLPQKSLAIFARGRYGDPVINYPLFPSLPIDQYQAFILRNSGQDWTRTMLRDALHHTLARSLDIDKIAYRPGVLFINGQYWGIHNIREKVNEHYLASHHGIDPENVDLLEDKFGLQEITGNKTEYLELLDYLETHDMSVNENYDYIKDIVDIKELIDYTTHQTFFITWDWPGGNIKYWRSKTASGKWRWILTDTDYGSSFLGYPPGTEWQPPSTNFFTERLDNWLFFSKMIDNDEYKNSFINRFGDRLNTIYHSKSVLNLLDSLKAKIEPEMHSHIGRWGGSFEYPSFTHWLGHSINSIDEWKANLAVVGNFAADRPAHVLNHLMQRFNISQQLAILLDITSEGQGKIQLNSLLINSFPWTGKYFQNIPIRVTALPDPGYRFVRWNGDINSNSPIVTISMDKAVSLRAEFVKSSENTSIVVINEINYNSDENSFNPGDWLEFYNNTNGDIDLSGWVFKDDDDAHIYTFPTNTVLDAGAYIVLCRDTILFKGWFADVSNYIGNTGFGFAGNGERLRLFNDEEVIIDSLRYDDQSPWPTEPDGNGPTLSLRNPSFDNSVATNWAASESYGTPGKRNSDVFVVNIESSEDLPNTPIRSSLFQNFPNPFNNNTVIHYSVGERAQVSIVVYSLLGQKVKVLCNKAHLPGTYSLKWNGDLHNGEKVSSGIYLYKIMIKSGDNDFIETKKMLLLN